MKAVAGLIAALAGLILLSTEAMAREAPAPTCQPVGISRDSFCTVRSLKLHFVDWGGKGPAIILLTGLGNSARIFDQFGPLIAKGHRVIAITRRGYGASANPVDGDYSNSALVNDILGVMDGLNIRRASFIGHSIAGGELATLGADHPDRVTRLIYLDSAYDRTRAPELIAATPAMPLPTQADRATLDDFARWRGAALGTQASVVRNDLEQILMPGLSGLVPRTTPAVAMKILAGDIAAKPRWSAISAPSLALFSSKDVADQVPTDATPQQRAEFIAFSVSQLRPWMLAAKADFSTHSLCGVATEISRSTHHIFLERPRWTAQIVLSYLASRSPCSFRIPR